MLSDTHISLYNQLTEVSLQIESSVTAGDFSEIGVLSATHNDLMTQIKDIGQIDNTEMLTVIQKAEESVRKTMAVLQQKQGEITQQLNAEKNKKLLSNSYNM